MSLCGQLGDFAFSVLHRFAAWARAGKPLREGLRCTVGGLLLRPSIIHSYHNKFMNSYWFCASFFSTRLPGSIEQEPHFTQLRIPEYTVGAQYMLKKKAHTAASLPVLLLGHPCFSWWKETLEHPMLMEEGWPFSYRQLLRPILCHYLFPAPTVLLRFSATWPVEGLTSPTKLQICPALLRRLDSPSSLLTAPLPPPPPRNHDYF